MEYLVLGPASMGLFAIVGSLMKYEDDLKNIKEISGASAGAAIAVALALNIPIHDMLDRLLDIDIPNVTKFKIKNFVSTFGFVEMALVRETLVKAYRCDPTFSDLKKKVYISSYCVNRARTEYFSVDTHPHMKVVDALCMSMAIPILFSSMKYNGMIYIDGCTKECYPITPFIHKNPEKIMCIRVKQKDIFIEDIKNIKQYLKALVSTAIRMIDTNTIQMGKIIELDVTTDEMFNFNMTHDEKLMMFMKGTIS